MNTPVEPYGHCTRVGTCDARSFEHAPGCLSLVLTDAERDTGVVPDEAELRHRTAILHDTLDGVPLADMVADCRAARSSAEFRTAHDRVELVDPLCAAMLAMERRHTAELRFLRSHAAMVTLYGPQRSARIELVSDERDEARERIAAAVTRHDEEAP